MQAHGFLTAVASPLLAWLLCGVPCSVANGQWTVPGVHVQINDWRYTPILSGPAGAEVVHSFLALGDPATMQGSNIAAVWYRATAGCEWVKKAWQGQDEWKVIKQIKSELGIGSEFDDEWAVWSPKDGNAAPAGEGVPYERGFFLGDYVGDLVNASPARDSLVAALVSLGYSSADIATEKAEFTIDCECDAALAAMRAGVEAQIRTGSDGEALATAALAECAAICLPWTWVSIGPSPWSACNMGAFALTGSTFAL